MLAIRTLFCLFLFLEKNLTLFILLSNNRASSEKWLLLLLSFLQNWTNTMLILSLLLMPGACHPITSRGTGCLRWGASPANDHLPLASRHPRLEAPPLPSPPITQPATVQPPTEPRLIVSLPRPSRTSCPSRFVPQHNYNYHTSLFFSRCSWSRLLIPSLTFISLRYPLQGFWDVVLGFN